MASVGNSIWAIWQTVNDSCRKRLNTFFNWIKSNVQAFIAEVDKLFQALQSDCVYYWEKYKLKVQYASTVASTATSTFKTTFELGVYILPLITSMPLIGMLFPSFFFTDAVLYLMITAITGYVALLKYAELRERTRLDNLISENQTALKDTQQDLKHTQQELVSAKQKNVKRKKDAREQKQRLDELTEQIKSLKHQLTSHEQICQNDTQDVENQKNYTPKKYTGQEKVSPLRRPPNPNSKTPLRRTASSHL